jgi:hypothetical protein
VLGGEEGVTSMKKTWIKVKAFIYEMRERESYPPIIGQKLHGMTIVK